MILISYDTYTLTKTTHTTNALFAHAGRQAGRGTGDTDEPGAALSRGERLSESQRGYPFGRSPLPRGGGLGAAEHDLDAYLEAEGAAQQGRDGHGAGGELGVL